jgi:class 3 adenylate cyclase/tetratricopeptide (TPR) repeat protein
MTTCPDCGASVRDVARFCDTCGATLEPGGGAEERKLVTVLFADVTSSTALGDQLDPERLRALLAEYFAAMSAVIGSWGGTVEKYIGDAVMAVFGAPLVREDDAERALHAALEMLERLESVNHELSRRHGVSLRIRIGVNTGEVVAPQGGAASGQLIVSGDAVNVAARLEQAADPGTVLVGERTYLAARHAFAFGDAAQLTVKGKPEPIPARRLLEPLPEAARGIPGLQAPMVGRERELGTVIGLVDEAIETAEPRLVLVFGPAGIGKSRLVRETLVGADQRRANVRILRGRCLAAGHGITFWALGEILRAACDISLGDSAETSREKLREVLGKLLKPLAMSIPDVDETIAALAATANISLPQSPIATLEPRELADVMARAWPSFVTAIAHAAPAVLVIEDLHWADDQLLEMLEQISTRATGGVLILATARPEFAEQHPGFGAPAGATTLTLRPLTDAQSTALVDALLDIGDLPEGLRGEILARAEGNPFFLEEILRRLIDEGAIVRAEDRWVATSSAAHVELPDSIHTLLAARIDGLPPEEKRVLQDAAVVGRAFWEAALGGGRGTGDAGAPLRNLERRGLVVARPTSTLPGQVEYLFRHALIRDVAYAAVPKARRAIAHAEVGAWIERLAGERLDELGELVAYHYRSAVADADTDLAWAAEPERRETVRRRAFQSLVAAGAGARRRFAVGKAVELHGQALELADSEAERATALEELGDDHEALFHGDNAIDAYQLAAQAARAGRPEALPSIAAKAAFMAQRFGAFERQPSPDALETLVDDGLRIAIEEPIRARLLAARASLEQVWEGSRFGGEQSRVLKDPVRTPDRIQSAEEAWRIADRLGLAEIAYLASNALAGIYWRTEDYPAYHAVIQRQLAMVDTLASERQRADILFGASAAQAELGDYAASLVTALRGLELARRGSPHEMMHLSFSAMNAAFCLGSWGQVLDLLPAHLEAEGAEGDVLCAAVRGGPVLGAIVLVEQGRLDEARSQVPVERYAGKRRAASAIGLLLQYAGALGDQELRRSLVDELLGGGDLLAPTSGRDRPFMGGSAGDLLESLATLGDWSRVEEMLPVARRLVTASALLGPVADRAEGRLRVHQGDREGASALMQSALAGFERLHVPFEAARTREELAELAPERATELRAQALATYEQLGAMPHIDRLRATLA